MKLRKRVLSIIVMIAMIMAVWPGQEQKATAAASSATLSNFGKIGSLKVGKKTKSGNWYKIYVGGQDVFCLNVGYTCHRGDVYNDSSATYSSNQSGKNGLRAYIGYWFDQTKKRSNKAYIFAQALLWSVEEGGTSESELKDVIQTMKSNTGYYSSSSADDLYKQIFKQSGTLTVKVKIWKYTGSGSHRQELMEVEASSGVQAKPHHISKEDSYRQRITLDKTDEDGKPLSQVEFCLTALNIDELYYFKANGWGNPESGDVSEDIDHFELVTKTDSSGRISYRFNYHLQSKDYYYYTDSELKEMDNDEKKKAKEALDDEGYRYHDTLTKDGAEDMANLDIQEQMRHIENSYEIKEVSSGNDHIMTDPEYEKGKIIVLDGSHSWQKNTASDRWPDEESDSPADYVKTYKLPVTNRYKKVSMTVVKEDGYSDDKKAHGSAQLEGALFGLYQDAGCSEPATVYTAQGKKKKADVYCIENGKLETDYLRSGERYYLKECKAPKGYKINQQVIELVADGRQYRAEYTKNVKTIAVTNMPILGKIAIQKYSSDGSAGIIPMEKGVTFEIFEKSKGSYDNADTYERDRITTDKNGYACTKDLYYGVYKVHQLTTGGNDTQKVPDFEVVIEREDMTEPQLFPLNNPIFSAYLRVVKRDGNTKKNVLKPGTSYEIYHLDKESGKESLVTQSYIDGYEEKTVQCFHTDERGVIMTVSPLESGTYRIYEKTAAAGYHISVPYVEVDINSESANYQYEVNAQGKPYVVVTADYTNQETYGRLTIYKTGEQLVDFKDGRFVYENRPLNDVVFEIYADEDIITQDNQNTKWFEKNDLVGTVTTGRGAEFTNDGGGICKYTVGGDGTITVALPLGKYRVIEKQTNYGYVLTKDQWKVSFDWENQEQEYVLNSSSVTDEDGILQVENDRAKAAISLKKTDAESTHPVSDAVFALYTADDIYNAEGNLLITADTMLGTVSTDTDGRAHFDLDVPLMTQGYQRGEENKEYKNSGDYYIKELSVSDSYYPWGEQFNIHLEYQGNATAVVSCHAAIKEIQTAVEIDKVSLAEGTELRGCELQVLDNDGRVIVSWISGREDSIRVAERWEEFGYSNLQAAMDEKGNIHIGGLLHDREYTLRETNPADGYVTAEDIRFRIVNHSAGGDMAKQSLIQVKRSDGEYEDSAENKVCMKDDTTKVEFRKIDAGTNKLLGDAIIAVYDSRGQKVHEFFSSGLNPETIIGLLRVGETYTFREMKVPAKYKRAKELQLTVQDSGEIQKVVMSDERLFIKASPKTPTTAMEIEEKVPKSKAPAPKTGAEDTAAAAVLLLLLSGGGIAAIGCGKRRKRSH